MSHKNSLHAFFVGKKSEFFEFVVENDFFCFINLWLQKRAMECIEMKNAQFFDKIPNFFKVMTCLLCHHLTIIKENH